ncbi:FadR/GntR family transcriptional regulator [Phyllobacterium sp. SB3]|uniref:FadR/GntR family transcriptional regulator n=1 Tax=Phyllobacterium sp. SB3 TaxID=3156073 RepID=UPI0032AF3851
MTLKLDKVNRGPHLSTLVASSISREIAEGRLKAGDQLPTEQALASTFGVSRNVVREAIARLRSEGRIWSQQGRGAFVADEPNPPVLTIDYDVSQQGDAFKSLFELRGALEVKAASLAAERRTQSDLDALKQSLTGMQDAPYGSVAWLQADLEFHRAIVAATRNTYMEQFLVFVAERVRDSILAAGNQQGSDEMASTTLGEHNRIYAAIADGDPVAAARTMQLHLDGAAQRVGLPTNTN